MQGPDEVGVLTLGQLLDLGRRVEQSGLESLSSAERQAYEQAREWAARQLAPLQPLFQRLQQQARRAAAIQGCDCSDVIEKYGERYRELTAADVIEQGRHGLRGRRALDAALAARVRSVATAPPSNVANRAPHAVAAHPRERSSRRAGRSSRASPARPDDPEPEPPGLAGRRVCACGCGRVIARVAQRGPQPETVDASCRQRLSRQRKHDRSIPEHEPLVIDEIRAGRLAPYQAILWVVFPDLSRQRYPNRVVTA